MSDATPAPRRLVRLEDASSGRPMLVDPGRVEALYVNADGVTVLETFGFMCCARGTPEEVAARLGLAIDDGDPAAADDAEAVPSRAPADPDWLALAHCTDALRAILALSRVDPGADRQWFAWRLGVIRERAAAALGGHASEARR